MTYAHWRTLARLLCIVGVLSAAPLLAQPRQIDDGAGEASRTALAVNADERAPAPLRQAAQESTPVSETDDPTLRITQEEFKTLLAARKVTVVDVRDAGAFAAGHIPGALSIPLDSVEQAAERLRKLGKPVVTYCS